MGDLHAAVLEDLDADGPRLVLADALQRIGDPRGELIAIQCELARLGCDRTRVALWKSPGIGRSTVEATRRADWIGDAFATGERDQIAQLRRRERALLAQHEKAWAGSMANYRFGRGFIEHVYVPKQTKLDHVYRTHIRSFELAEAPAGVFESDLLEQCRQLRVVLAHPTATAALIDRLGGINPGTIASVHGALPYLRELAFSGLADASGPASGRSEIGALTSAFDRLIAAPGFAALEALDLYNQLLDSPERIEQIVSRARLRDLRIGLNYLRSPSDIGAPTRSSIYQVLARTPAIASLEILDLFYAGLENTLAPLVSSPRLQTLRALRIVTGSGELRCFEDGARALGEALPELRVLDLRYSPFNRFLQDLLGGSGLRKLTHLGLRGCSLTDISAAQLAESPLFKRLRVLDLRDNAITDKGARALASRGPGKLERLELGKNKGLSIKARDLLNAKFPDAEIEIGKPPR